MNTLWKKAKISTHPKVHDYIISKNCKEDMVLLPYDIQASRAHAKMLCHKGLISKKEWGAINKTLLEILELLSSHLFAFKETDEDSHSAIENYLTKKLRNTGKKIHMGRSRNDQVLVALRLYSKKQLQLVSEALQKTIKDIVAFAKKYEFIPMSGYTHTQQAMLSSVGQWAGSFAEALKDDADCVNAASKLNDQNPLGSAAGFGTSIPIDRECTTKELGFSKTQNNCLYCQNSRGKIESFILSSLMQVMMTLNKCANDLIWFTSQEFDFFTVDPSLTTGSSIMPQKKNLDILEVLRANAHIVQSFQFQVQTTYANLLSGYNKDMKITKKALIESFQIVLSSLHIIQLVFKNLKANTTNLKQAILPEIYAADKANELVLKGMPFRDAYHRIAQNLADLKHEDPVKNLKSKKHPGAPGNLQLDNI